MYSFLLRRRLSKSTELILIYFIIVISIAALDSIWAVYFSKFGLSNSTIGFISGIGVLLSLLFSFISTPIMQKYDKVKLLIISLTITIICYLIIYFFQNLILFIILSLVLSIAYVFRINSYYITFRDYTKNKDLNQQEGLQYSLLNLSWIIGPLIGGYIALKFGIINIFLFSAISMSISLFIFILFKFKSEKKEIKKYDYNFFKNIKDFFKDKKHIFPYMMAFGIYAWSGLLYIYAPLFITKNGISEYYLGLFFAAICIPNLISDYFIGKLSEKIGFKKFFIIGYFGLFILSITLFLISNIIIQIILLVIASFFVSCIEALQDTFFFKTVSKNEEEKYYPVYSTAIQLGSFSSKIIIALILLFFADNYAYLSIAILFFILLIFATQIRQNN